jgi:hypothetical protein
LVFAEGAESIRDAKITKAGSKTNKSATPMSTAATQNTQNASPDKQSMETTVRNYGITAGMQLIQAIELIIRQSEYVVNQAAVKVDESSNKFVPNPAQNKDGPINWFYIECYATIIGYDQERNDNAVKIIYVVRPYKQHTLYSPYFNHPPFPGVHKSYPYWFTGRNTAVIQYEADFSTNSFLQLAGNSPDQLRKLQKEAIQSLPIMLKIQASAASNETRQGAEGRTNEISASAAEYLYSAAGETTCNMKIIGDPAWLAQGEYTGAIVAKTTSGRQPFLPDGTINFTEGQILFELVWQRPGAYDLTTGLQDPYAGQRQPGQFGQPIQSVVYFANKCVSSFRGGQFTQDLTGEYYRYPKPDRSNAVTPKSPTAAQTPQASDSQTEQQLGAREGARESALAALLLPSPGGALPAPTFSLPTPSGDTGVAAGDNNVGIPLRDETGQASTLRINPETGELYNAAGLPAPPRAPSATQQDALTQYIKEIGAQDPEFVDPTRIPNPPAPDVYGQIMNRET